MSLYPLQIAHIAEDCVYLLEEVCPVCIMAMSFGLSAADNRPELMEEVKFCMLVICQTFSQLSDLHNKYSSPGSIIPQSS